MDSKFRRSPFGNRKLVDGGCALISEMRLGRDNVVAVKQCEVFLFGDTGLTCHSYVYCLSKWLLYHPLGMGKTLRLAIDSLKPTTSSINRGKRMPASLLIGCSMLRNTRVG
jgi:hypothetical protein